MPLALKQESAMTSSRNCSGALPAWLVGAGDLRAFVRRSGQSKSKVATQLVMGSPS